MTFPVVESVTESNYSGNVTSHLMDLPATVGAGNLLLMVFTNWSNTAQTTPSGWTALDKQTNGVYVGAGVYARDADGSESGTSVDVVTAAPVKGSGHIYRISGWGGTLADDVDISTVASGTGEVPNSASVTAGWGSDDNLFISIVGSGDDDVTMNSAASGGYGNLIDTACGGGANASGRSASARLEQASAADDPGNFTLASSEAWLAWTVVVEPAGAAAGTVTDIFSLTWAIAPTWSTTEIPDSSDGSLLAGLAGVISGFIGTNVDPPITVIFDPGVAIENASAVGADSSHVICMRSGFKYKVGTLIHEDGLWVHPKFAEPRHPSELAGHMRPERVRGSPRPEKDQVFIDTDNPVSADSL